MRESPDRAMDAAAIESAAAGAVSRPRVADFIELTKPRLNFLVIVTTAAGFYMAVRHAVDWVTFLHAIVGTALTAAGASALNQYAEREYDGLMARTAARPLPAGRVASIDALAFGVGLAILGVVHLAVTVNLLTAGLGAFTLLTYIFIYTPLKRRTTLNTIVGAVAGAVPFVMGWTAVRGELSQEALALFAILFLWQMPHFLAISSLYREEYAKGGFVMLPVVDDTMAMTGRQMVLYTLWLIAATLMPFVLGMAGMGYMVIAAVLGTALLKMAVACAKSGANRREARRLFLASVLYLPLLLAAMMIDKL